MRSRSEEHTSELQSLRHLVCRLLLECSLVHPHLHSFPTRRSSDLAKQASGCALPPNLKLVGVEGVTGVEFAALITVFEPAHPLLRRAMRKGVGHYIALRLLLDAIEIGRAHV